MGKVVKNTIKCGLLDLIAPERCRGCGDMGEVLCERCKNYIKSEYINKCPKCGKVINYRCDTCVLPFQMAFVVGKRGTVVGRLSEEFKFFGVRSAAKEIAEVMDMVLPEMDGEVVVVPMPTINKHIRERGVDHTLMIAKELAAIRGWKASRILVRKNNTVQVGADAVTRKKQAKEAFQLNPKANVNPENVYLLLDDVWTTGASMMEAGKIIRDAGGGNLAMVVIERAGDWGD